MLIGIDASRAVTDRRTGTEAYAWHLIRALVPLANVAAHQVKLYYNEQPSSRLTLSPHQPVHIPARRLWTHLRLAAELHRRPPDVFFTPAHVIPFSYRGAGVATIHDLGYHYFPEAHSARRVRELIWSTRHNATRSCRVIADSEATKRDLGRFYKTPPEKVSVVYPGADDTLAAIDDEKALAAVCEKYAITAPYFLFLSTLQPRKNLLRLLSAFVQIADEVPQQLVLAGGSGWLAQPLLDRVAALPDGLRERVRLTGFVDESDKAALISGATAMVYPSLYEGFGFPVVEAQSCGTAVMVADSSSLPEVAGDAALLVSAESTTAIANAMRRLVTDDVFRHSLIAAGFENVKRFRWQTAAEQVLAVLEQAGGSR